MDEQRDHFQLNNIVRITFFLKRNWMLSYGNCSQNNIWSVGTNFIFQNAGYAPVPLIHICSCHSCRNKLDIQITKNWNVMLIAAPAVNLSTTVCVCSVAVVLILVCKAFGIVRYLGWCLFRQMFTFKNALILRIWLRTILEQGRFHYSMPEI